MFYGNNISWLFVYLVTKIFENLKVGVNFVAYKIIKCGDHRTRRSFSRIKNTYELTDLLEIQKKSYNWFVEKGIKEVFEDLFPVENFAGTLSLEFGDYHFDELRNVRKEKLLLLRL